MRRCLFVILMILLVSPLLPAQNAGSRWPKIKDDAEVAAEQRQLIGQWCHMEFDGVPLEPEGWKKMSALTTIKDQPEFQVFYVVLRYEIQRSEESSDLAIVTYYSIGSVDFLGGFVPHKEVLKELIRTTRKDDQLLVGALDTPRPFVSRQAALRWLQGRLETAGSNRVAIQKSIAALTPSAPAAAAK